MTCRTSNSALVLAAILELSCILSCRAIKTGLFTMRPQITASKAKASQFQASLTWKELSPGMDVSAAISVGLGYGLPEHFHFPKGCSSGHLGALVRNDRFTLQWSMYGRQEGQVVPVGKDWKTHCVYSTRDFRCQRDDYTLKTGVLYTFTMQMEMQNASGAIWSVTVAGPMAEDARPGHPVEIGRVFFKDRELNLPSEKCRMLDLDIYGKQQVFTHEGSAFATKVAWSSMALSGVFQPEYAKGYCGDDPSRLEMLEGLSLVDCKNKCAADPACQFASYTANETLHATVDGTFCMTYASCGSKSPYLADIWWTYAKRDLPRVELTGFEPVCRIGVDQNLGKEEFTEWAAVTGEAEFQFEYGTDVDPTEAPVMSDCMEVGVRHPGCGQSLLECIL